LLFFNPWRGVDKPILHLAAVLHRHAHLDTVRHLSNTVGVLVGGLATKESVHIHAIQTLCMRHGAFFMSKQKGLEVDYLLAKLRHSGGKGIVLSAEQLNLGLQIGKPLLLALTALERSNPVSR
jgi:hypothetical protein